MLQLQHGLWLMESARAAHAYLVATSDRLLLVDPGPRFQLVPLARELRDAGRSPFDVTDVLVTHYDPDHAGAAAAWRRRTGAVVRIGAEDAEVLRTRRPPGTRFRRDLVRRVLPQLPEGVVELHGDTEVAPGLTAVPAPGHTPGHYAYVWQDAALIGDAAVRGRDGRLRVTRRHLLTDAGQAAATLRRLEALPVRLFGPGHGAMVGSGT